ncbi:MAG TPA: hypothetical protein PLF37_12485 [Planctomycetota bacterium]|nr:hypothetical protein [Planctomycetota bacterium]
MKRVLMFAAVLGCFVFAGGVFAQAEGEKPAGGDKPAETPEAETPKKDENKPERRQAGSTAGVREVARVLRERDKDQDRKISKEEFGGGEEGAKVFGELDADKDGFLTMQELTAGVTKLSEEMARQSKAAAEEEFNALDRDSNKKLSKEELGEARAKHLELGDKDKDGSLSLEEYIEAKPKVAAAAAEEEAKKRFDEEWKNLDKDGDGKLTGDEIPERMKRSLDRVDTDKDGAVSKAELETLRKSMEGQGRQRGQRGQGGGRQRPGNEPPKKDENEGF